MSDPAPRLSAIMVLSEPDASLAATLRGYVTALSALPYACDLTIVGNGALQASVAGLARAQGPDRVPIRIVALHRDCDQSTAIQAGLEQVRGAVIALLPSYVQTDPEALARMMALIDEGADYVASWRSPRIDSRWGQWNSSLFNRATRWLTGLPLHDVNSDMRMLRRELARKVPIYGHLDRFWPVLAFSQGFRVAEVKTRHLQERVNRRDYGPGAYVRRLFDLLTVCFLAKFTQKPLRFFGLIGGSTFGIGMLWALVLCVQRLLGQALASRPALVLAVLLIVLGIQVLALGLLGELMIFTHGRKLRHYRVDRVYEAGDDT